MSTTVQVDTAWEVTPETTKRLKEVRKAHAELARRVLKRYYNDPVAFAEECIDWGNGRGLAPYQKDVLRALVTHKRVAQRGPHGLGKSTTSAIAALWFAITRDQAGMSWKVITTAGGWHQLEHFLWPEIHLWANRIKWERLGRGAFTHNELITLHINLRYGSAFAAASNMPARMEGGHADQILYIFDEAKVISNETFDAAEGAFSGATEGREAYALASSTPGEPIGRFYDIHAHKPGFEDWWTRHVTLFEAIHARRVSVKWARQRKRQWGPDSQIYANRALGEFHASEADVIIPLRWIEEAVQRWHNNVDQVLAKMDRLGVDVAGAGDDQTVLAPIHGLRVQPLTYSHHEDTDAIVDKVKLVAAVNPRVKIVVDADGIGVGVYDNLNNLEGDEAVDVHPFHAGGKTDKRDKSGALSFANAKAAAWWQMREELDPMNGSTIELPPDELLTGDLCAPKYEDKGAKGIIVVESKDEVKKRLGRSPDSADAVVMGRFKERMKRKRRVRHAGVDRGDEEMAA